MRCGLAASVPWCWAVGPLPATRAVTLAAQVPFDAVSLNEFAVASATTMTLMAGLGGTALLSMLLLLSVMESRMRAALQTAMGRADAATRLDALTGLSNRSDFEQRLDGAVQAADRTAARVVLLFVGLDSFKPVNDTFGRRVGDQLLTAMAERLQRSAGVSGSLARVGGDEFACC